MPLACFHRRMGKPRTVVDRHDISGREEGAGHLRTARIAYEQHVAGRRRDGIEPVIDDDCFGIGVNDFCPEVRAHPAGRGFVAAFRRFQQQSLMDFWMILYFNDFANAFRRLRRELREVFGIYQRIRENAA